MQLNFLFNFTIIMGRHSPNIITRKEILPYTWWHPFEDKLIYQPKINKSGFSDLLGNNLSYGGCLVNNWPTAVFEKNFPRHSPLLFVFLKPNMVGFVRNCPKSERKGICFYSTNKYKGYSDDLQGLCRPCVKIKYQYIPKYSSNNTYYSCWYIDK